ncbi:MAG: sensor histidine kinase [Lacibacter sp.]
MNEILKNKKLRNKLFLTILITTPLFGLIAGIPFVRFELNKFSFFIPGIAFITGITFLFWLINITLLILEQRIPFLQKIVIRSAISICLSFVIAMGLSDIMRSYFPPPQIKLSEKRNVVPGGMEVNPGMSITNGQINLAPLLTAGNNDILRIPNDRRRHRGFFFPQFIHALTINMIILIVCELFLLTLRKQKIEFENQLLRQSNLEARNNQLKMQLHPHFLFNSLNTLRLLMKKDQQKAEQYLLQLADVLRFSTSTAHDSLVSLKDELQFCLTYLDMQKTRFQSMLTYTVANTELYTVAGKLPVYALLTLVENAIKHNTLSNEAPLHIAIDYEKESNTISIKNTRQPKAYAEESTGIGLQNLAERYRLLANETIVVKTSNNEFAVTIKILS